MPYRYRKMESPVGRLTLVARDQTSLVAILWEHERPNRVPLDDMQFAEANPILAETEHQLSEYFAGSRTRFELPLDFQGTEFQKRSGTPCLPFPSARPAAIRKSQRKSVVRRPFAQLALPMGKIRFPSLHLAIG